MILSEELRTLILGTIGDPNSTIELITIVENRVQRSVNTDTILNSKTDHKVLVDSSDNVINITLPPGQEGMEFIVKCSGNANSVNIFSSSDDNIDPLFPNANLIAPGEFRYFTYETLTKIWWIT